MCVGGGGFSLSEISGVLLRILHPITGLCVWLLPHKPAWIIVRRLAGKSQMHIPYSPRGPQRLGLLDTIVGFHGNKQGWKMVESN